MKFNILFKIIIFICIFFSFILYPESKEAVNPWTIKGLNKLLFNQVSFSNWTSGGDNSFSSNVLFDYNFVYKKEKISWDTKIKLGYGFNYQERELDNYRKTNDLIELVSTIGYDKSKYWDYSFQLIFKTQFTKGFKYSDTDHIYTKSLISDLLSPGYLFLSPGFKYKKNDNFYFNISPGSTKITFLLDKTLSEQGNFGVSEEKHLKLELGALFNLTWKHKLVKNINIEHKVNLYSNYLEKPYYIDVNYEFKLIMKVNKSITVDFGINLIYDYDTKIFTGNDTENKYGKKVQIKQTFGTGIVIEI